MVRKGAKTYIKIMVVITYLVMITLNALANIIPINGRNTGEISDSYKNLFAPAGFTFAIWGLIYFLLVAYTIYQLGFFQRRVENNKGQLMDRIGIYFSISSIANSLWILAWHYDYIPISMILMIVILVCLILINQRLRTERLSGRENIFIRIPFGVYFGWITVATVANVTTLLVSLGWNGFGLSEVVWTVIILIVAVFIGIVTTLRNRDIPYGLVILWAYTGILIKHISDKGFALQYPTVITTVIISIAFVLATLVYSIIRRRRKLNK